MSLINKISPKQLFLVDSLGALLSALMLGVVLVRFESTFGMPQKTLYLLSSIACIFFIYSSLCFLYTAENWRRYMKIIAITNLMYCCLTMGLVIYLYQKLTVTGVIYFILEIIVILILVTIELKIAFSSESKMKNGGGELGN